MSSTILRIAIGLRKLYVLLCIARSLCVSRASLPAEFCYRQTGPHGAARPPQHGRDEDFARDGRGDGRRQTRGGGDVSDNSVQQLDCVVGADPAGAGDAGAADGHALQARQPRLLPRGDALQGGGRQGPGQGTAVHWGPTASWLSAYLLLLCNRLGQVCTEEGKFSTRTLPAGYQEPQRCQHRRSTSTALHSAVTCCAGWSTATGRC